MTPYKCVRIVVCIGVGGILILDRLGWFVFVASFGGIAVWNGIGVVVLSGGDFRY